MYYGRNSLIGLLVGWTVDKFFEWRDARFKKKAPREFIKVVPNTDPDRFYHRWVGGERMSLNELPEVQLTVLRCDKSIDEVVQIICADEPLVLHTGHSGETCPGVTLPEGLKALLCGQPSTWQIRTAFPMLAEYIKMPNLGTLDLFLAQEFEGSVPGNPNRDICNIYLDRSLGPMELELRIPHYGVRDGYCAVVYLRIDLKIDPEIGVIVTGHEDNMDSRPQ